MLQGLCSLQRLSNEKSSLSRSISAQNTLSVLHISLSKKISFVWSISSCFLLRYLMARKSPASKSFAPPSSPRRSSPSSQRWQIACWRRTYQRRVLLFWVEAFWRQAAKVPCYGRSDEDFQRMIQEISSVDTRGRAMVDTSRRFITPRAISASQTPLLERGSGGARGACDAGSLRLRLQRRRHLRPFR